MDGDVMVVEEAKIPELQMSVILAASAGSVVLSRVLDAYRAQTCGLDAFEIIVTGDGLEEPGAVVEVPGMAVRVIRRAHASHAAALNSALDAATGRIVLFSTDEFLPAPDCLAAHLAFHKDWALDTWAVLGKIDSAGRLDGDDAVIADGHILPHERFHAGNLSLKRSIIGDDRFDDSFGRDSWMDVDLGFRLRRIKGVQLKYLPTAVCSPAGAFDAARHFSRVRLSGWYELAFYEKHDQLLGPGPISDLAGTAWHSFSLLWTFASPQAAFRRRAALARLRGHWRRRMGHPAA